MSSSPERTEDGSIESHIPSDCLVPSHVSGLASTESMLTVLSVTVFALVRARREGISLVAERLVAQWIAISPWVGDQVVLP